MNLKEHLDSTAQKLSSSIQYSQYNNDSLNVMSNMNDLQGSNGFNTYYQNNVVGGGSGTGGVNSSIDATIFQPSNNYSLKTVSTVSNFPELGYNTNVKSMNHTYYPTSFSSTSSTVSYDLPPNDNVMGRNVSFSSSIGINDQTPPQDNVRPEIEFRLSSANIPFVDVSTADELIKSGQNMKYKTAPEDQAQETKPYKRPRRRSDQIDRYYSCKYEGCMKSYGTLNHLNAHVLLQNHGPRRKPSEFKEIKKAARAKRREEQVLKTIKEFSQKNNLMFISLNQNNPHDSSSSPQDISSSSPESISLQSVPLQSLPHTMGYNPAPIDAQRTHSLHNNTPLDPSQLHQITYSSTSHFKT